MDHSDLFKSQGWRDRNPVTQPIVPSLAQPRSRRWRSLPSVPSRLLPVSSHSFSPSPLSSFPSEVRIAGIQRLSGSPRKCFDDYTCRPICGLVLSAAFCANLFMCVSSVVVDLLSLLYGIFDTVVIKGKNYYTTKRLCGYGRGSLLLALFCSILSHVNSCSV